MKGLGPLLPLAMLAGHVMQSSELASEIGKHLKPDDIVLVKGSLGTNMAPIVDAIRALGTTNKATANNTTVNNTTVNNTGAPKRAANGH